MPATSIECHIGMASRTVPIPSAFADHPSFIARCFQAGSGQAINLIPRNRCSEPPLVGSQSSLVDALDLHLCVEKLTGNRPGVGRVSKIALVLADRYGPRDRVFGIMFDRGYPTEDDPNTTALFTATPREGCAIFLGAIRSLRPGTAAFDREVEFTTIHELGHIFNLEHDPVNANFMATSVPAAPYPDSYFNFRGSQQAWLAQCDANPRVYPGGSPFGPASAANDVETPTRRFTRQQHRLHIGLANLTFPSSLPVELDVALRCSAKDGRTFVPDRLDPGYEQFKILITRPDGETVRFGSPRQYCAPASRVMVSRDRPLRRDVSLFEGTGGTTFATPGTYKIVAEFDLGRRGVIQSNALQVEVVPDDAVMNQERSRLLASNDVRRFLYHRSAKCGNEVVRRIEHHLLNYPDGVGANDLRYALIRALAREAIEAGDGNREKVLRLIAETRRHGGPLGVRQRHHITRLHKILRRAVK